MLPPSLMMIVWILQFAVNIQDQRENLGMIMTMTVLFTFPGLLLLRILSMRELAQILFLRETLWSRLLSELEYLLLHPILVRGLAVVHVSILLLYGFVVLMESWNMLISVSLSGKRLWENSTEIYSLLHLVYSKSLFMLRQYQRKSRG
jgi:hypothetical protein